MNHQGTKGTKNGKMNFKSIDHELDEIASRTVDSVFKIHRFFGPGLLESAYEACLIHELKRRGLEVENQVAVPLVYDGVKIDIGFRMDLLVRGRLIVELKAVESILPIHEAQVLTYLKVTGHRLGLLKFQCSTYQRRHSTCDFVIFPFLVPWWFNRPFSMFQGCG